MKVNIWKFLSNFIIIIIYIKYIKPIMNIFLVKLSLLFEQMFCL